MTVAENAGGRLERLSEQYPAVHLDAKPMSDTLAGRAKPSARDQAEDFAPFIGKGGRDFEREALLTFYDALNEQRDLVGVMED